MQRCVQGGKGPFVGLKRAQILLAADAGPPTKRSRATSRSVRRPSTGRSNASSKRGLERALSEVPRPGAARKLGASEEALLVAVACSKPPEGRARWTLELLADEMVRLTVHATPLGRDGRSSARRDAAQAVAGEDVVHPARRRRVSWRAWRTCSSSTPSRPIERRPVVVLRRDAAATDRRSAGPDSGRARKAQRGSTTSTSATAPRTCSCSST